MLWTESVKGIAAPKQEMPLNFIFCLTSTHEFGMINTCDIYSDLCFTTIVYPCKSHRCVYKVLELVILDGR